MRVNTNISALIANSQLKINDSKLSRASERLSTGLKINHSADDSAGMAIASKMRSQITGLNRSSQNASDGVSVVQTAEGALNEVHSILQRMRELAVQGANGTNSDEEREAIQDEVTALTQEIERISRDTEYNKKNLLDGSMDRRTYTNVSGVETMNVSDYVKAGTYGIKVTSLAERAVMDTIDLSAIFDGSGNVTAAAAGEIDINGYTVKISEGESKESVLSAMTMVAGKVDLVMDATDITNISFTSEGYGTNVKINISTSNSALAAAFGVSDMSTGRTVQGQNMKAELLESADGGYIGYNSSAVVSCQGMYATITDNSGFSMMIKVDSDSDAVQSRMAANGGELDVISEVTDIGMLTIHVGANEGQVMDVRIPRMSLEAMSIDTVNYYTQDGCSAAITQVDKAIAYVSSARSSLGAYQNRLDAAVSSLDITEENMTAGLSRLEDVDMAAEMTEYTKLNVLAQAGISMVSQANERPQMVLQMLQ